MSGEQSSTRFINQSTYPEIKWNPVVDNQVYPSAFVIARDGYPFIPATYVGKMLAGTCVDAVGRKCFEDTRGWDKELVPIGSIDDHFDVRYHGFVLY